MKEIVQNYKKGIWDLDDLVKNPTRQTFDKKIKEIQRQSEKFAKNKSQLKPNISSRKFLNLLHEIEDITEKASKVGGYAGLKFSEDTQSDEATALLNRISQFGSTIENKMLFFDLWWKKQVDVKKPRGCLKKEENFQIIYDIRGVSYTNLTLPRPLTC